MKNTGFPVFYLFNEFYIIAQTKQQNMKKLLACAALSLGLVACSSVSKIKTTDVDYIRKTGVISHPILAEVEIQNTKVSGQYIMRTADYAINPEYGKNMAIAHAIQQSGADYLVHPMFEIIKKTTKTEINVTGYPGKYKNFRNVTAADSTVLQLGMAVPVQMKTGMVEVGVPVKPKKVKRR